MKLFNLSAISFLLFLAFMGLAACGGSADKTGETMEETMEETADAIENEANNVSNQVSQRWNRVTSELDREIAEMNAKMESASEDVEADWQQKRNTIQLRMQNLKDKVDAMGNAAGDQLAQMQAEVNTMLAELEKDLQDLKNDN